MYQCQLNLALFCATSAFDIFWRYLNHPNFLVRSVCRFHAYFHVQIILHNLSISLPHEDDFGRAKNTYIKSAHYSICGEYGVNVDYTWINKDSFYTTKYGALVMEGRLQKGSHQKTLDIG